MLLPRTKLGWVFLLVLAGASFVSLLHQQAARFGSYAVLPFEPLWLVAPAALACLLVPRARAASDSFRPRVPAGLALVLIVSACPLFFWRLSTITPRARLPVSVSPASSRGRPIERVVRVDSLRFEARQQLSRIAGRRRDFALQARGFLGVPRTGLHRFELDCDDRCVLDLDGERLMEASGLNRVEVFIEEGIHPFAFRYRQRGGPAHLRWSGSGPRFVRLLSLGHYLSGRRADVVSTRIRWKEREAAGSLLASWFWCLMAFSLIVSAGERREHWRRILTTGRVGRLAPVAVAGLLLAAGAVLRFDALLVRSHGVDTTPWASRLHHDLRPFIPDYRAFYRPNFPDPYGADVRSYLDHAADMGWGNFYRATFREPFYVVLVKLFVWLVGGREVGVLVQSFVFSVASLGLFYGLATRLTSAWWAVLGLFPVALHEWLVLEAPSGYRMSAYSCFLLAFVGALFLSNPIGRWRGWLLVGVLGAMLCLIRLSALSVVVPALVLAGWQERNGADRRWWGPTFSFGVLTLLVAPFLLACYLSYGDPFYPVSFHTQFWLRAEGLRELGGPRGLLTYFADFHTAGELILGNLRGLTVLPLRTFWRGSAGLPVLNGAMVVVGVAGLIVALRYRARFMTLVYLAHLVPFAFIQNFASGRAPRFVMPAYFFLVLAAIWLARHLVQGPIPGSRTVGIRTEAPAAPWTGSEPSC